MARAGNASTGLVRSATVTTPTRWSLHGWYRALATPVATRFTQPITFGGTSNSIDSGFSYDHSSTASQQAIFNRRSIALGGTYDFAKFTTALQANTWYGVGGSYDGTNVNAYLNGLLETQVGSADIAGDTVMSVFNKFSADAPDDGTAGEVAYWSVALTAGEFLMLGRGVSPLHVRPERLILYWPLHGTDSPETDWSGQGFPGTVTATTVVDHPPVQLPFWSARDAGVASSVQVAVPVSDASAGLWTGTPNASLYANLTETFRDDTNYMHSGLTPSNDTCKIVLGDLSTPQDLLHDGIIYVYGQGGDARQQIDLTVSLYQGAATLIKQWVHTDISTTLVQIRQTLSSGEAGSITYPVDHTSSTTQLSLWFSANAP